MARMRCHNRGGGEVLQNQLEALLFSSGKAMSEEQLAELTGSKPASVRKALKELQRAYEGRETALKLFHDNHWWRLLVKEEYLNLVRRVVADTELGKAALETLAVIAYHSPVLQSKVVELRGGNAYEHIKELVELGFITKTREGRSYKLKLTEKFFEYFEVEGAESIKRVFKEVQPTQKARQQKLGELEVVDELPEQKEQQKDEENDEQKEKLLGDLVVVDEPTDEERDEQESSDDQEFSDDQEAFSHTPELSKDESSDKQEALSEEQGGEGDEQRDDPDDFLKKIEEKIDRLAARNDEREEEFKSVESDEGHANAIKTEEGEN